MQIGAWKCWVWSVALAVVGLAPLEAASASETESHEAWAAYHFVGWDAVARDADAANLVKIAHLPATRALVNEMIPKLSVAVHRLLTGQVNGMARQVRAKLQPLVTAAWRVESRGKLLKIASDGASWLLAFRVGRGQVSLWSTNLWQVLGKSPLPSPYTLGSASGWRREDPHRNSDFFFLAQADWVILALGPRELPALRPWVQRIERKGSSLKGSKADWFEGTLDLPRLMANRDLPFDAVWPHCHVRLKGHKGNPRWEGTLTFRNALKFPLEPWHIPTKLIREPLVSFTAGQGLGTWLAGTDVGEALDLGALPSQYYIWGLQNAPFLTFFACPFSDVTNHLARVAPSLADFLNTRLKDYRAGHFAWVKKRNGLVWKGLPILYPFLRPAQKTKDGFLFAGMFPPPPVTSAPPPAALLAQVEGQKNLVYYHWEITALRLSQWQRLASLLELLTSHPHINIHTVGQKWLIALSELPGDTITQVTRKSGRKYAFVRRSPLGLSGLELVLLADWIDAPEFPLGGFRLPFQPLAKHGERPALPAGLKLHRRTAPPPTRRPRSPKPHRH